MQVDVGVSLNVEVPMGEALVTAVEDGLETALRVDVEVGKFTVPEGPVGGTSNPLWQPVIMRAAKPKTANKNLDVISGFIRISFFTAP